MFIGTVQCEVELSKTHRAFQGYRFLLIDAEHEVEWEGSVVAIDTVGAQVGDMVVVALAPLGSSFDLPEDLPVDGATIGIVSSITTPAEDGEAGAEEAGARPPQRLAVESKSERPPIETPTREERPVRPDRRPDVAPPRVDRPDRRPEAARGVPAPPPRQERDDRPVREDRPIRDERTPLREPKRPVAAEPAVSWDDPVPPAKAAPAPRETWPTAKTGPGPDLDIVWDSGAGSAGGDDGGSSMNVKRPASKRRRR